MQIINYVIQYTNNYIGRISISNSRYTVPGKQAGANGAIIASLNYFYETKVANEFVELIWWAPDWNHIFLSTIPEIPSSNTTPYVPETPTAIVTVSSVKVDSNN